MLDADQTRILLSMHGFASQAHRASQSFAIGYGGLWRPIPIPEPYKTLFDLGLCILTIIPAPSGIDGARAQWAYVLTDKGKVVAKMLRAA